MYDLADMKRLRRLLGLTQTELASLSGVSQSLIAKIEAGKVDPSYTRAKRIFEVLESHQREGGARASDIMVREVITADPEWTVGETVKMMNKRAISQLPIVKGGEVVGSVSEKTLVERIAKGSGIEDVLRRQVRDIMEQAFPSVSQDSPLDMVAKMLNYTGAVLIYQDGKLAGIITRSDILKKKPQER
ncbi:MAG TPA: CBS domain-containing protein [Conexivisphaerales archaeon]|nr:CBS domain-containing protein [Conexivisphaerales archaeon]